MDKRVTICISAVALTVVVCASIAAGKAQSTYQLPGTKFLLLNEPVRLRTRSRGVEWNARTYHLVSLKEVVFRSDLQSRLTARVSAEIQSLDEVDYDVHAAVYDAEGNLLGTARAPCAVPFALMKHVPGSKQEILLDFGISRKYKDAARFAFAISDRQVLTPDEKRE